MISLSGERQVEVVEEAAEEEEEDVGGVLEIAEMEADTEMMITCNFQEKARMTSSKSNAIDVETMGIIALNAIPKCQKTKKEEEWPGLSVTDVAIMGIIATSATQSCQKTKKEERRRTLQKRRKKKHS